MLGGKLLLISGLWIKGGYIRSASSSSKAEEGYPTVKLMAPIAGKPAEKGSWKEVKNGGEAVPVPNKASNNQKAGVIESMSCLRFLVSNWLVEMELETCLESVRLRTRTWREEMRVHQKPKTLHAAIRTNKSKTIPPLHLS